MIASIVALALTAQTTKFEPVLGGLAEAVVGTRPHPEQKISLYMRRSRINALLDQRIRQAANDPWIKVGETRTSVKDVVLEGFPCLMLESTATRDVLANNPMEGVITPRVVRKVERTRRVWVAEDGSILKTTFEQRLPEAFSIEMVFGQGLVYVYKTKDGKKESAQVDLTVDPNQFENEFLAMGWGKQIFKKAKTFATLDPFAGNIRTFSANLLSNFEATENGKRVSGFRTELLEGKERNIVWVTNDGRLLQVDLANGDRLQVGDQPPSN
jgi:hypothetical protein